MGVKKTIKKYTIPGEENQYRPHLLRFGGLVVVTSVIVAIFAFSSIHRMVLRGTSMSDFIASVLPAVLVDLANADRTKVVSGGVKLGSLTMNDKLTLAAQMKAKDMARLGYFAHYGPDGTSPWYWIKKSGYSFVYAGENLAVNFDDSNTVNTAWMNSPGHKANILSRHFTEVGIAVEKGYYNGKETTFVVQMFGSPAIPPTSRSVFVVASTTASSSPEASLRPLNTSKVLGESTGEIFISVIDESASPASSSSVLAATPVYSSILARLAVSPSKILLILYVTIAAVLVLIFIAVARLPHEHRAKHIVYIVLLLLLTVALFYFSRYLSGSSVQVLPA